MPVILVALATATVTSAVNAATGVLGFASTTGFVRGAYVSVAGATSGFPGVRCIIMGVTTTTLTLGALDQVTGRSTGKAAVLTGFTAGDVVTQEEQHTNILEEDLPPSSVTITTGPQTFTGQKTFTDPIIAPFVYGANIDHTVLHYTAGVLDLVTKWGDVGATIKVQESALSYTSGVLTGVVVQDYVSGVLERTTTKTLSYTSGALTGVAVVVT